MAMQYFYFRASENNTLIIVKKKMKKRGTTLLTLDSQQTNAKKQFLSLEFLTIICKESSC
jgi:hypothetical protein